MKNIFKKTKTLKDFDGNKVRFASDALKTVSDALNNVHETTSRISVCNCPINEQTGDGTLVGRCWFYLEDGKTCPRHGDVSKAVEKFKETGNLTLEYEMEDV